MRLIVQNAWVYDGEHKQVDQGVSIVVEDEMIVDMLRGSTPPSESFDHVIDGSHLFVLPGFVNAHLHSHDRFDKGRFDAEPLERWMALYNCPLGTQRWTPHDVYLRTTLNCLDLLRSGTTLVIDDVRQPMDETCIDAVYRAYRDCGIKAIVSSAYIDGPYADSIPFLGEELSERHKAMFAQKPAVATRSILELWQRLGLTWRGRVSFAVSPSAVQRCSESFLKDAWKLAKELDVPVITHLLESRVQKATGMLKYGKSMVQYMEEMGLLTPSTLLAHAVWVTDDDIARLAASGAAVVHNPVSNMKLGSGIAPVYKMLKAGIPVGIGTDNNSANDNASILEAMKAAVLLSRPEEPNADRWLTVDHVLQMATRTGSQLAGQGGSSGVLRPGMRADFVGFSLHSPAFIPLNNACQQLVLCENGSGLRLVVIDGKLVMQEGVLLTINEQQVLRQAVERSADIMGMIAESCQEGSLLAHSVGKACARNLAAYPTPRSLL